MIVKNEAPVIGRCLNSVTDLVDEIIIVDTGSTDNTKEIVNNFTNKIFDFEWINNFSAARNYSYSKATNDYILWLDADDVILEEDKLKFKELKQNLDLDIDMILMKYNVGFDESGNITLSYFRERLTKRTKNLKWIEPVHEYIERGSTYITSDVCITHKKESPSEKRRNLNIYENTISQGTSLSLRGLYYFGRELLLNDFHESAIKIFNEFLNIGQGWVEENIRACFDLATCYSLINSKKDMLKALLRSFEYDTPRCEICCQIGLYYFNENDFEKSIFWYELATSLKPHKDNLGFILYDSFGYTPCIQLCICYYKLGNIEKSIDYNNKASEYKPNDTAVAYNKSFFDNLVS
jgi:glycosyltransferase involved in cell wall biosynthesis